MIRKPTPEEIVGIQEALTAQMGGELDWEPNWDYVSVIPSYMSDGPSWTGKVAMFPGGEICFINVALFDTINPDYVVELKSVEI